MHSCAKSYTDAFSLIDACYFFGRGLGKREKASFLPATIAYQLVLSRASCGAAIQKILAKKESILLESFPSQFRQLVLRPAKALASSEAPVTIVIDALDECDNARDQVAVLTAILEAATTANVRFAIASRPEQDIHAFFQRTEVSQHTYHIRLDGDSLKTSQDIEIFLRAEFARIRKLKPASCPSLPNGEEWPGNAIIYRLRDDSDCQFIFPTLIIAFIDTPFFSPDQQLKSLLAATPPARAFSKLDALYHHILSRHPPELLVGSDELLAFQKMVMGILRVIVVWPKPLPGAMIASVLDEEIDVVQNIIRGPMCSLFIFDPSDMTSPVTLCHKSLRDYLLDRLRSHEFFISDATTDLLFTKILSRRPPPHPPQPWFQDVLMGVLMILAAWPRSVADVPRIASVLDVSTDMVERVVLGPTKVLFDLDPYNFVNFSDSSISDFLGDPGRAGDFFVSRRASDTLLSQILSRQPTPGTQPYPQDLVRDVLMTIMTWPTWLSVHEIASILGVSPEVIESVVFGQGQVLFRVDSHKNVKLSIPEVLVPFLHDARRAGKFFIRSSRPDALFIRILSRQPPSDSTQPYSRDVMMAVLTAMEIWEQLVTVSQIATVLDVDPTVVESVVFGPARSLFCVFNGREVCLLSTVKGFLRDARRAGEFYVRTDDAKYEYLKENIRRTGYHDD